MLPAIMGLWKEHLVLARVLIWAVIKRCPLPTVAYRAPLTYSLPKTERGGGGGSVLSGLAAQLERDLIGVASQKIKPFPFLHTSPYSERHTDLSQPFVLYLAVCYVCDTWMGYDCDIWLSRLANLR